MRSLVYPVVIASLLLVGLARPHHPDAAGAEEPDEVRVFVRANPLLVSAEVLGARDRHCGVVPVIVRSENLGNESLHEHSSQLLFDETAFRIVNRIHVGQDLLRAGEERVSVWIIEPRESGNFVLMASAQALLDGELISAISTGSLLSIDDCRARSKER